MKKTIWVIFAALAALSALSLSAAVPERKVEIYLKDIARLQGVRSNQLMGYGVVVGLDATGDKDQTKFTVQSLTNLMARQGINIDPAAVKVKNVAAVMVTAELPPFSRTGQKIDVTVSSTGDAKSLAGGTLLMTPLLGPDNQVYAVAQGSILVGGFAAVTRGGGGSTAAKNHPTAGRIPDGALIEREVPVNFSDRTELRYALLEEDFSTAVQVVGAINEEVGEMAAKALDPRTIDVVIPREFRGRVVELVARLENLPIQTQPKSREVVNATTGTLIMGAEVRVSAVNIVHGGRSIQVSNDTAQTQNEGTADGKGRTLKIESGVTVGQLAESLNTMGVSPQDLVAILQAIKDAGAMSAELRIL
jgi:flagellar P-ring protein precursor FlgI